MNTPDISVIIPVYNASAYFERCLHSLFGQTLQNIEFIFINDCTPDNSFAILQQTLLQYPNRQGQVIIINHDENKGVAEARKSGMLAATGTYSTHCDPDDWMETTALEKLYSKAVELNADVVRGGAVYHQTSETIIPAFPIGIFSGLEIIKELKFADVLWSYIIRTWLIRDNNILPFEGLSYGEDSSVIFRALALAKTVVYINDVAYHYDNTANSNSLSKISCEKKLTQNDILFYNLQKWMNEKALLTETERRYLFDNYKEKCKSLLLLKETRNIRLWYKLWPETLHITTSHMEGVCKRIFQIGRFCPFLTDFYLLLSDLRSSWQINQKMNNFISKK